MASGPKRAPGRKLAAPSKGTPMIAASTSSAAVRYSIPAKVRIPVNPVSQTSIRRCAGGVRLASRSAAALMRLDHHHHRSQVRVAGPAQAAAAVEHVMAVGDDLL